MSGKCRGWAGDQDAPTRETKLFLIAFADYASAEQIAWPAVETLAGELQCSSRTVQRMLKQLVAAQLLVRLDVEDRITGRTRTCGYYFPVQGGPPSARELASFEATVGGRVTRVSPWEGDTAVTLEGDTGVRGRVTTVSPLNDPPLNPEEADASSARAGARGALFEDLEKATPARVLGVTDQDEAWDAFNRLGDAGVDLTELPEAMRRMSKDPLFLGRKVPWSLERWLAKGQYRGWLADPQLPFGTPTPKPAEGDQAHAASPADRAAWAKVADRLRDALSESTFGSYFARAYLAEVGGQLHLVAASATARDWIRAQRWRTVVSWWGEVDAMKRPLTLVSKIEFDASAARQLQGVG